MAVKKAAEDAAQKGERGEEDKASKEPVQDVAGKGEEEQNEKKETEKKKARKSKKEAQQQKVEAAQPKPEVKTSPGKHSGDIITREITVGGRVHGGDNFATMDYIRVWSCCGIYTEDDDGYCKRR